MGKFTQLVFHVWTDVCTLLLHRMEWCAPFLVFTSTSICFIFFRNQKWKIIKGLHESKCNTKCWETHFSDGWRYFCWIAAKKPQKITEGPASARYLLFGFECQHSGRHKSFRLTYITHCGAFLVTPQLQNSALCVLACKNICALKVASKSNVNCVFLSTFLNPN